MDLLNAVRFTPFAIPGQSSLVPRLIPGCSLDGRSWRPKPSERDEMAARLVTSRVRLTNLILKHALAVTDADPAHVRALLALGPEDWGDAGSGDAIGCAPLDAA
jgi:hypothetical protein